MTFTVTALDTAAAGSAWQSKSITELFSAVEVEGALYYWSTGSAGVMRAQVSDRIPEKFYTDPKAADAKTCVACHTLSRDGKRLAVGYGGEKLREVSVPAREKMVPAPAQADRAMGWSTFSPDGKKLLIASGGVLTLIDADTGVPIGPNNGVLPLGATKATHPDWSALGDKVVVAIATKAGNKDMSGGSIALIPYNDGAWGAPQVIVQSTGDTDHNFFPVFSPDSKWIAYVNASTSSKDANTARLRLVSSAGGSPVELVRLNGRVNNADRATTIGNSMPTWAPSTKPGIFWLAFSSLRAPKRVNFRARTHHSCRSVPLYAAQPGSLAPAKVTGGSTPHVDRTRHPTGRTFCHLSGGPTTCRSQAWPAGLAPPGPAT